MPIRWSRIHAELGLTPTPLTHEMLVRSIEFGLSETDDLDWKRALPADAEKKRAEFAKDVAMLANTRGGLIAFGVREENERAVELTPVPNGERERQRLRALANGRVHPMVNGLTIEAFNDADGGQGLLVVHVPASPDTPHVCGDANAMGIPYRVGTDTRWMTEHELERAYRDRFTRRADDRVALSGSIDALRSEIDLDSGIWVGVATRPVTLRASILEAPQREHVSSTMDAMQHLADKIVGRSFSGEFVLHGLLSSQVVWNPQIGLRRWVLRSNHQSTDPSERVDWALIELHHDGAVALAARLGEISSEDGPARQVPLRLVDGVIAEAVALATSHAQALGVAGTILVRAELLRDEGDQGPLIAVDNRRSGHQFATYHRVPGSSAVRRPVAVEA